ncbi:hypothetical protein [Kordia sp.]|uniref:hypothetical protein n=1 Tax=Kordia sp. TaxID=1965332 RepID=UPI003B593E18
MNFKYVATFKKIFLKKEDEHINVKRIICIEPKIIKFCDIEFLSINKKSTEEFSFSDIEWIKTESDLLDYSTLESIVYIKIKSRSSSIHFSIIEDHEKEFVKELFKTLKVDEKHLTFLNNRQKSKMAFIKNKESCKN